MSKQLVRIVVGTSILIIGLLAVVSCVPGDYQNVEAAGAGSFGEDARALADAASLARWQGLGRQFSAPTAAEYEPATAADAARWEARGAFYSEMAEVQLTRGQAASVAR